MKRYPPIKVSNIEIVPISPRRGHVAFASCELNGCVRLDGIGIHSRRDGSGFRLTFPSKLLANGRYLDLYFPTTKEAGDTFQNAIVSSYLELMGLDEKECGNSPGQMWAPATT